MEFIELDYGGCPTKITREFGFGGRVVDIHQKDLDGWGVNQQRVRCH